MQDFYTIEAVERYLQGEMQELEAVQFEELRKVNPELDQLVVSHHLFLEKMQHVANRQNLQHSLNEIHQNLLANGTIASDPKPGKLISFWKNYKKTAAVAACIAGITTLTVGSLLWKTNPNTPTSADIRQLNREIKATKTKTDKLESDIASVISESGIPPTPTVVYKTAGTGFFIDASGMMLTNAHIVSTAKNISVVNTKGDAYKAEVVKLDAARDMAIIKITDKKFKSLGSLPYGFSRKNADLAAQVFTLGYPRDEVVYGEGYISAKTGFKGDTLSCQVTIPANPGNSGGPVFNKQGEIIGILSAKQTKAEGVAFAVQSKYIYSAIEELKADPNYKNTRINSKSSLSKLSLEQQIKKIQDYVWMVKVD